jgi:hypothetical protein
MISGDSTGVRDAFKPNFTYGSAKDQVVINFSLNNSPFNVPCEFIHDGNIGPFDIYPDQGLENHDGSRIIVTNDFHGDTRNAASPMVGPFQDIQSGTNQYVVYQGSGFNGVVQDPYGGSALAIPGTIQAEAYDKGGEGISYHDTSVGNETRGPYRAFEDVDADFNMVGWIGTGEWLEYTVDVAETGLYDVALRASAAAGGGSLHIEFDGVDKTGSMIVPNTAGSNNYTTVVLRGISLNAGQHIMRVYVDGGGWNFDYVAFSKNDGTNFYVPVADSKSVTTTENTAKAITLTGSDGDFDLLTYTIVNQPLYGTLSGVAPNVVYTPNSGYGGKDAFSFKVNDGTVDSAIAVVSIMVATGAVAQAALLYQSDFTGADLASAGLQSSANTLGGVWSLNTTDDRAQFAATAANSRANLNTINAWTNAAGLQVEVSWLQTAAGTWSEFGLMDANVAISANPPLQNVAAQTAIGFAINGGTQSAFERNTNSTAELVLSTAQGAYTVNALNTMLFTVTSTTWSYSLNGQTATTGTFATPFDTSKGYRFYSFIQSSAATGSYVSDITVTANSSAISPDIDSDGLPNSWETSYFGGPTNANPANLAANGINTIYETYIAGLNPTNAQSVLTLSIQQNAAPVIQWSAASGRVYSVYWTSNLFNNLQLLATNIVTPQNSWTDQVHGAKAAGFYQIKVEMGQ